MSLLERRRVLMGLRDINNLDGRECVAVGSNNKLYWSLDYGKTFVESGQANGSQSIHVSIARNKSQSTAHIFFTYGTKAYYVPAGVSGTSQRISVDIAGTGSSVCCSGDGTIAYVPINSGTTCTIKKVTRSSSTLSQATKGTFSTWDKAADMVSVCSNDGKYAVIGGAVGYTNAFQTVNTGETWTECLATSSYGNGTIHATMDFTGTDCVLNGGSAGRNSSWNALSTWTHQAVSCPCECFGKTGDGTTRMQYRVTVDGALQVYTTGTQFGWPTGSWTNTGNTTGFTQLRCNRLGNKLIGLANGVIYYSHNWGRTWTASTVPSGITFTEIDMTKCD